jgi:hypothetical protein
MRCDKTFAGNRGIFAGVPCPANSSCILRHALAAAVAAICASCASTPDDLPKHRRNASLSERLMRETVMNETWQRRRYADLVEKMGKPKRLMTIPGGGNPPSFVADYGLDPATGCIDAFAITHGENPIVRDYYCR